MALTLDACMGAVDLRILGALVDNGIAATLFVTGRWLKNNADALVTLYEASPSNREKVSLIAPVRLDDWSRQDPAERSTWEQTLTSQAAAIKTRAPLR